MKIVRAALFVAALSLVVSVASGRADAQQPSERGLTPRWEPCGWGGGGFYWAAAFHPTQDGVIYMGGDVAGVYKTLDHGRHWRLINNGLVDYGVYSLAVDRVNPQTVYAATEGGLCKSTDGGEHWQVLPRTGRQDLRLTGERDRSVRCIAVDPTDSHIVYAGSPGGSVVKSTDGGQSWTVVSSPSTDPEAPGTLRVQFGKVNADYYGGIWLPLACPTGLKAQDCVGFGFAFKGDGTRPQDAYLTLKTSTGASYRSKNLNDLFQDTRWRDVLLHAQDFVIDPEYAKSHADAVKTLAPTPDWSTVNRMDFGCSGPLPTTSSVARFGKLWFAATQTPDGRTAPAARPIPLTVREFTTNKVVQTYGNIRTGDIPAGTVYSVVVAPITPNLVVAATEDRGLLLSHDAGHTWTALKTPRKALNAAFDPADSRVIYGAFAADGIEKSTDGGATWASASAGLPKTFAVREIVVSPANAQDVYAIGAVGWNGGFYRSHDGGVSWQSSSTLTTDVDADPTLPAENAIASPLSTPTNLVLNPLNPRELFISANWRPCLSQDGGATWTECDRGADISVITDVRFSGARVYASAMDEGSLVSDNNGQQWHQMWPLKWTPDLSGHNWRLAITSRQGVDRIIATCSPWDAQYPPRVIISADGGKTFKVTTTGLPDHVIRPNTMWGVGHPRALAVDPHDPQIVYLGIDGDPGPGQSGGGVFKSQDGGATWQQLPNQPGSRRMFYGLSVDPINSQRVFWAACGTGGGLWRSEDGGASWQHIFTNEAWPFNVVVTPDGTIYCPGQNLWRSTDHGATWKKLTTFKGDGTIVGLEADPRDSKTLWLALTHWDGSANGGVYKTVDGGATWQDITGDLPYVKPTVLRFNPATNELWAAGVGLFKLKQ